MHSQTITKYIELKITNSFTCSTFRCLDGIYGTMSCQIPERHSVSLHTGTLYNLLLCLGARKARRKTARPSVMLICTIYIIEFTALLPDVQKKMARNSE